jgi:hypothetical protein
LQPLLLSLALLLLLLLLLLLQRALGELWIEAAAASQRAFVTTYLPLDSRTEAGRQEAKEEEEEDMGRSIFMVRASYEMKSEGENTNTLVAPPRGPASVCDSTGCGNFSRPQLPSWYIF